MPGRMGYLTTMMTIIEMMVNLFRDDRMKKNCICNITMQEKLSTTSGTDHDAVVYPVIEYMSRTLSANDDLKILLLCKTDQDQRYLSNIEVFKTEFEQWCGDKCQTPEYKILDIPFAENVENHSNLIRRIAAECEPGSSIVCDITYGAKSLPIILFSVLAFATQHLKCTVEKVLYRQVYFRNGVPTNPELCDFSSLLHLTSLIYTLNCETPEKAQKMLDTLLSM